MEEYRETNTKLNTKNTKQKRKFFVGLVLILCLLFGGGLMLGGSAAEATSLYFSPSSGSYGIGSAFSVSIFVSSPDQLMNAAGGVVSFPRDKLEITSLSKSGSIITFWAQEPVFSNSAGTVNFEGVVLPDGFKGQAGRIITLNFKAKATGTAPLKFSTGSVLAHDGRGTNILRALGTASYALTVKEYIPPEEKPEEDTFPLTVPTQVPPAPTVSSPTHSDPDKWHSNNSPEFSWDLTDITGVRLLFNDKPGSIPTVTYMPPISERKLENLENGIWYFHIRFQNQYGWGAVTHRKVMIDTVPPLPFSIDVERDGLTDPSPVLFFETTDELSSIEYYEVKIEEKKPFLANRIKTHSYTLPPQPPGVCKIKVLAFDKAGNYTSAQTEIEILPIETPVIVKYPARVTPGESFTLEGRSLLNVAVKIFLQRKGEEPQIKEIKSDSAGNWIFTSDPLKDGSWEAWVQAKDEIGALSVPSEKISFQVGLPPFLEFGRIVIDYLTVMITLIVLIVGALIIIFYGWYRISLWRKRVRTETKEVSQAVLNAFRALREEVEEQIEYLDGKPGITKNERQVRDKLKEALNVSEQFISKELKDIEKELE